MMWRLMGFLNEGQMSCAFLRWKAKLARYGLPTLVALACALARQQEEALNRLLRKGC